MVGGRDNPDPSYCNHRLCAGAKSYTPLEAARCSLLASRQSQNCSKKFFDFFITNIKADKSMPAF
jgi:hypothetical protein